MYTIYIYTGFCLLYKKLLSIFQEFESNKMVSPPPPPGRKTTENQTITTV